MRQPPANAGMAAATTTFLRAGKFWELFIRAEPPHREVMSIVIKMSFH